jgi:energy-coupling factor transporter ATP-binding protein EcfA2
LFESYNLQIYRAINETLRFLKEDLHVTVDAATDAALSNMCSIAYRDMVKQSLINAFKDELNKLGMHQLQVDLEIDDLLADSSKIAIRLTNNTDVDKVLSEAELKCCALALFLAECNLMEVQQPIIFDDPVNSLDASIIQAFTNRLSEMTNEIIIFTHNVLFMEDLTDDRQFKVYDDPVTDRTKATTPKRHVLAYDVLTNLEKTGFVLGRKKKKTLFYLDSANAKLNIRGPITDVKSIVEDLRMAVEWAIDEVIFRGLPTRRFKGSELTDWITMEAMASAGVDIVRDLKSNYDQLSGMGVHLGTSSYTAPPSPARLQTVHDDIERIFRIAYP